MKGTEPDLPEAMAAVAAVSSHRVDQVAFLVRHLEDSMRLWSECFGRSQWKVYTYGPDNVADLTYRGEPGEFSMRLGLAGERPQIELIQPLEGPSIYHEWISAHGFGLHHVGFFVPSIDHAVEALAAGGCEILQSGRGYGLDGDGGFAYFETPGLFDFVLEAIEVPARRRRPENLPSAPPA